MEKWRGVGSIHFERGLQQLKKRRTSPIVRMHTRQAGRTLVIALDAPLAVRLIPRILIVHAACTPANPPSQLPKAAFPQILSQIAKLQPSAERAEKQNHQSTTPTKEPSRKC